MRMYFLCLSGNLGAEGGGNYVENGKNGALGINGGLLFSGIDFVGSVSVLPAHIR